MTEQGSPLQDVGPHRPRRSLPQVVFGSILIGLGVAWLIAATNLVDVPWRAVLAVALAVIGVGVAGSAGGDRHRGLVVVGAVLAVVLALASTAQGVLDLPISGGIGERSYRPTEALDVRPEYRLGIGELQLDLTGVAFPPGEASVEVSVTLGSLIVILPDDVAVSVTGRATAGEVTIFGSRSDGTAVDETFEDPGFDAAASRVIIDAAVGLGEVEVRR